MKERQAVSCYTAIGSFQFLSGGVGFSILLSAKRQKDGHD